MKVLLLLGISVLIAVMFSGCVYTKRAIKLTCEQGVVMITVYEASVFNSDQKIDIPLHIRKQAFYEDEDGNYMKCIKE